MISKNLVKYINSLELKKNRTKEKVFVAEGPKVVADLMKRYEVKRLIATTDWFTENKIHPEDGDAIVTEEELRKISFLQHPQKVMALFTIPNPSTNGCPYNNNLCLALDTVQDPGNLGTIIRIADWFGISTIYCSKETADAYNPKVVQATMGSIARVNIIYTDLKAFIDSLPSDTPIYGTALDGEDIYNTPLTQNGIIIMGNEGNGISSDILQRVKHKILIPCYQQQKGIDSLNVAVATAVTCAEFKRRSI